MFVVSHVNACGWCDASGCSCGCCGGCRRRVVATRVGGEDSGREEDDKNEGEDDGQRQHNQADRHLDVLPKVFAVNSFRRLLEGFRLKYRIINQSN